jgi:hypothetical protein
MADRTAPPPDTAVRHGELGTRPASRRFLRRLAAMLDAVAAEAGPGPALTLATPAEVTAQARRRWPEGPDVKTEGVEPPGLSLDDGAVSVAVAVSCLERAADPAGLLDELARVTSGHLVLAVGRQPWRRLANLATGRHLGALGREPGSRSEWRTVTFMRFASDAGAVRAVDQPAPWTILWVRRH